MNATLLPFLSIALAWAALAGIPARAQGSAAPPPVEAATSAPLTESAPADLAPRMQVTEMSCLRTLLVLDASSQAAEARLRQRLTEYDFRIFPAPRLVTGSPPPQEMAALGREAGADLVLHAAATTRELPPLDGFQIFEGESTVQIFSRVSGELLVSQTARAKGKRTSDPVEARRSALEKAIDQAAGEAVRHSLARSHKILVHEAVLTHVYSESGLLALEEYIARMDGVYHVRRLQFDRARNEALIEIIGAPHSETFWRAYLEKMPKTKIDVRLHPNQPLRDKYPDWFRPPAPAAP